MPASAPARPTLFISDLHLAPNRPRIASLFFAFMANEAHAAAALYILGDLFEYWIGDEDLGDPFNRSVADAIAGVTAAGVPVHVMHGNRDFLIGTEFARATGASLLQDPTRVDLHGTPTLLMHGDTLCTDDVEYMKFRAMVRNPAFVANFLSKTVAERRAFAAGLREKSDAAKEGKAMAIMDVNAQAVAAALRAHGYPRLIHGHTHRPARHEHEVDGHRCERYVLADWYESGAYLTCDASGVRSVALAAD